MRSKTYFFSRERFALRMSSLSSLGSRRTTSCKVWEDGDICDGVWRGCDGVGGEGMHLRFCPQCVQSVLPQCCILLCSWDAHATQPVSKTSDDCCSDRCKLYPQVLSLTRRGWCGFVIMFHCRSPEARSAYGPRQKGDRFLQQNWT